MAETITRRSIILKPADTTNVAILIRYTLDPAVQGQYKAVPTMTAEELEQLILHSSDRRYFEVLTGEKESIGRFYLRFWQFDRTQPDFDVELNIILKPEARGQGWGTKA